MNKQTRQNLLVGFTALLSIVAGILVFRFIGGKLNNEKVITVIFPDVMGVQPGVDVEMAGVNIGQVDSVGLTDDNRGKLVLGILPKYNIPLGSRFQIRAKVLGNSSNVEVIPAKQASGSIPAGATVEGVSSQPVDEALEESKKTLAESRKLIQQGEQLVATLNTFVGDPNRQRSLDRLIANSASVTAKLNKNLDQTLTNTTEITANLKRLSEQLPEMKMQVDVLLADLRSTTASGKRAAQGVEGLTGDARALTQDIDSLVKDNKKTLASLLQSADEAANSVAALTSEIKNLVGDKQFRANLTASTANIQAATANLVAISSKFDQAADNLQKLSGDPKLNADLRETVSNLKETTASFRNLAARVERLRLPGERRTPDTAPAGASNAPHAYYSTTSLLEPGIAVDSLYDTRLDRLRVDGGYTLLTGRKGQFYRLGLFDAGESNQLNLQIGQANGFPANFDYRYGFIAGKLGFGFDFRTGPLDWRLDAYNPNRGTLNARTRLNLNRNNSLTFGIDSLGRENRATLGIQIRR